MNAKFSISNAKFIIVFDQVAFSGLTMPNGQPFDQFLSAFCKNEDSSIENEDSSLERNDDFGAPRFASGDLSMWAIMDRDQVGDCQDIMMDFVFKMMDLH